MSKKTITNIKLLCCVLAVSIIVAFTCSCQEVNARKFPSTLDDLARLKLKVTGVRLEQKIEDRTTKYQVIQILHPEKGERLVVVTLEGVAPSEDRYSYDRDAFSLFCYCKSSKTGLARGKDESPTTKRTIPCKAIRTVNTPPHPDTWTFPVVGFRSVIRSLFFAGPVTIEIGFVIPDEVNKCSFANPIVASGEAHRSVLF